MFKKLLLALIFIPFSAQATTAQLAHITLEGVWARPTMGEMRTTAAYLDLINSADEDDTLLSVTSPASDHVMIHNTVTDQGVSRMIMIDKLSAPAHKTIEFKPGGIHIMLMNLKNPLKTGDLLPLTFFFKHAGEITVSAIVK